LHKCDYELWNAGHIMMLTMKRQYLIYIEAMSVCHYAVTVGYNFPLTLKTSTEMCHVRVCKVFYLVNPQKYPFTSGNRRMKIPAASTSLKKELSYLGCCPMKAAVSNPGDIREN
jgi:hypothetical protein